MCVNAFPLFRGTILALTILSKTSSFNKGISFPSVNNFSKESLRNKFHSSLDRQGKFKKETGHGLSCQGQSLSCPVFNFSLIVLQISSSVKRNERFSYLKERSPQLKIGLSICIEQGNNYLLLLFYLRLATSIAKM